MKHYLLLLPLLSLSLLARAQTPPIPADSAFHHLAAVGAGEDRDFTAALATLDRFAAERSTVYNRKKAEKSIRKLFAAVQDEYFVRYVENPVFGDIFSGGDFNCVTASALFSILFEKMDIPYEIRELPTHVYVVAYPDEYNIVVESTLPTEGVIELQERQLAAYRQEMIDNKLITAAEVTEMDDAFDLMMADSVITLRNLVGIQHYNYAIKLGEAEDYLPAIDQLRLARRFHDRDYITILTGACIGFAIYQGGLSVRERCDLFSTYHELLDTAAAGYMDELSTVQVGLTGEVSTAESAAEAMELADCIAVLPLPAHAAVSVRNNAGISAALYHYNALNTRRALDILAATYDSTNVNAYRLIAEVYTKHFGSVSDPYRALDTLDHYTEVFPFFAEDPMLRSFRLWSLMKAAHLNFSLGEAVTGHQYLQTFEDTFSPSDTETMNTEMVGSGYGAASAYYVREGEEKRALEMLMAGLKYAPANLELLRKKKLLESDTW